MTTILDNHPYLHAILGLGLWIIALMILRRFLLWFLKIDIILKKLNAIEYRMNGMPASEVNDVLASTAPGTFIDDKSELSPNAPSRLAAAIDAVSRQNSQ